MTVEEIYIQYYKDCCNYIEKHSLARINDVHLEFNAVAYWTHSEIATIFDKALELNRMNTVEQILDYYLIPKQNMNLKERVSYYQLMKDNL